MPEFEKPTFPYTVRLTQERSRLRAHKGVRGVPDRRADRLLLATWNIANLGAQDRGNEHRKLIAEILGWFDVVAIQEVRDNFADLDYITTVLGGTYRMLMSDVAGNDERMAFVYDSARLTLLEKIGEVAVAPAQARHVKLPGIEQAFTGFDRNPYLAAFRAGQTSFLLVNVHLYFGSDSRISMNRRALETYAVARWADGRRRSEFAFTREIVVLGDFNMPKAVPGDPIFEALTRKGLEVPAHSSEIGSSIASDNHYDQIAFFPGKTKDCFTGMGVFDYDGVIFPDLWQGRGRQDFNAYLRYYISDHRPLWMQLRLT